jgi:serine/threonine protein kinase
LVGSFSPFFSLNSPGLQTNASFSNAELPKPKSFRARNAFSIHRSGIPVAFRPHANGTVVVKQRDRRWNFNLLNFMASELSPVPDDLGFEPTIRGLESTQRVFDRYVLRRVLGRGGMGIVWLGHDERLDRDVALKFLPDAINFDAAALDDLKRETRRCLELTHPSIIRIYDFVQDQQAAAISMEYIDGQTLAALRIEKPARVFEVGDLRDWMIKACHALHYAHEEVGVVHRDIKPANFMVTGRGQMKVADFGIAQSVCDSMTRLTMRGSSSGTLAYMSPQQLNGEKVKPSDDIYALGATIYELLTGKPPFHTGDVPFQVRLSMPRSMAEKREELEVTGEPIPAAWEEAIAACLSKIPEERPATMDDLAQRLRLASPTRRLPSLPARPAAPVPDNIQQSQKRAVLPANKPTSRKNGPVVIGAAVLGGVLLLTATVAFWPRQHPGASASIAPVAVAPSPVIVAPAAPAPAPAQTSIAVIKPLPAAPAPAEIRVTSNAPDALIQLDGQVDQHAPAVFKSLAPGSYQLSISAPGYQPRVQTVSATAGGTVDLGSISLTPLSGNLNLGTVPNHAHYVLTGMDALANVHKEGTTPEYLAGLPAGTYQMTLSEEGFPSYTGTISVQDHSTQQITADLTELSLAVGASADTAKVIRGQMDAAQLTVQGKAELAALENRAFTAYLNGNLLSCANAELQKLKALGGDTSQQQTDLATHQLQAETAVASQLRKLIYQKKWAAANKLFGTLNVSFEKDSMDRLNVEFQAPLAQYTQQIDSAIAASETVPPEEGYLQIKTLAEQYPSELKLQLALAAIAEHAAPDHARLTDLLHSFHVFSVSNKDDACQPIFVDTQSAVMSESQQLDAVTANLAAVKEGTPEQIKQLASLLSLKRIYENRRIGSPDKDNPFSSAVNFFGKAVTGHSVVNNHPYFETRSEKRDAIADVQARVDALKASMVQSPEVVDLAQKNEDAFLAHVPWGQ